MAIFCISNNMVGSSLMAFGGGTIPSNISESTGRMTMKFLPDVKLDVRGTKSEFFFDIT